ncbi:Vps53-like protein [Leucosporidium creatinivorum]|uniref:Vps53-like protein n=1 Tax=Leucosporidium creatinivorum TaxID=106004 RepID=A0A1Y2G015_9BASI|nr:Vps53-like protein [Leucosporidium creatinivorum]
MVQPPPAIRIPPPPSSLTSANSSLPDLPQELLISAFIGRSERDALDSFVLAGAGASGSQGGGGVQVEDVLNELIPDENALSQAGLVSLLLRAKIQEIRIEVEELTKLLEEDQDPDKMSTIQELIGDLLSQVTGIRDAATESEMVVRDITRDIQSLDLAKKHLVASMNALKRFQMLVNAFDQLTRLAKSRRYRETAQALGAVKQLSQFFKTFSSVDRVAAVSRGVVEVQGVLRAQVMKEFEEAFANEGARVGKNAQLTDAALVVDALGEDAKTQLFSWYTLLLLRDYRRIFGSHSEAGQLDNISRRFAWFRRILKTHEDENAILFPPGWNVGAMLAGGFSEVTRDDLKSVLAKAAPQLQVGLLLEALGQTTEFEREMSRKYSMPFDSISALSSVRSGRPGPATAISVVFEPYLGIFVDAQDKAFSEMMQSFVSSRVSISPSDNPSAVLPSSTDLFHAYREALERCAKLSIRQPLLDLCSVYRKWLKVYAEDVLAGALIRYDRRSGEGRPNVHELQTACLVLNTAEYCLETASQLEERLQSAIHPDLRSRVTLEAEKELFTHTISAALLAILRELELTIDVSFGAMLKSPWKDLDFVSSESLYVAELTRDVRHVVEVVREGVEQKKYVRSTCDKVVGLVLAKFTQTIVRCRPIAQIGAEQILLDLQSLKTCLLGLVHAPGDSAPVPMSYSRYVSRSVLKIDTLLKVLMTSEDPPEEFVKHYLLLVPCQSFSDFQKVLDLKGVRRAEQNTLLDLFLAKTSTATGLSDDSFLTSLDMDPVGTASASGTSPSSSGFNSPLPGGGAGGLFSGGLASLPMLPTGSGGAGPLGAGVLGSGSRSSTPGLGAGREGGERGKEALAEFKRFGARIGMASRLFSGREGSS